MFFIQVVDIHERCYDPVGKRFVCYADAKLAGVLTPLDNRLPRIRSKTLPNNRDNCFVLWRFKDGEIKFLRKHKVNEGNYHKSLFVVRYLKWDDEYRYPLGAIISCFEATKDIDCGLKILDIRYGINQHSHYANVESKKLQLYVPVAVQSGDQVQRLKEQYRQNRIDLTELLCFTIDRFHAMVLDDALSIEILPQG